MTLIMSFNNIRGKMDTVGWKTRDLFLIVDSSRPRRYLYSLGFRKHLTILKVGHPVV